MNKTISITYDDDIVRKFFLSIIIWGIVVITAGVIIAAKLIFRELN